MNQTTAIALVKDAIKGYGIVLTVGDFIEVRFDEERFKLYFDRGFAMIAPPTWYLYSLQWDNFHKVYVFTLLKR